jgi:hypothetical protein
VLLATLTTISAILLPEALAKSARPREIFLAWAVCGVAWTAAFGYIVGLMEGAVAAGASGEPRQVWLGAGIRLAWTRGALGLYCIVAGPIVPAASAILFWIYCGDPTFLDWLIVLELAVVSISHAFFTFLSVVENGRLKDANPARVMALVHRLGWKAGAVGGAASVLVLSLIPLADAAVGQLRESTTPGWFLIACCWGIWLFLGTLLFRLTGSWCRGK